MGLALLLVRVSMLKWCRQSSVSWKRIPEPEEVKALQRAVALMSACDETL